MLKVGLHALRVGVTALALVSCGTSVVAAQVHRVAKGDTLWAISRRFGVSICDIERINHVSSNKPLKIGLRLTIPSKQISRSRAGVAGSRYAPGGKAAQRFGAREYRQLAREAGVREAPGSGSNSVVQTALACRGSRYVRGGTGRRGFDCSGLTRYVYSKYGVRLPHQSGAQASCGKPVSRRELRPGDLVFFQTRGRRIGHVGIYVGSNRFVHAARHGRGVIVSSLGEGYYAKRYQCARRVIPGP